MDATFKLEHAPRTVAGRSLSSDGHSHVLHAAEIRLGQPENLGGKAVLFCIALVHASELTCEERCLLTAGTGLELHNDVIAIMRIARSQQVGELLLEFLCLGSETLSLSCELGVLVCHLASCLQVILDLSQLLVSLNDRLQLIEALADLTGSLRVVVQLGVSQLRLEPVVFGEDVVNCGNLISH